jgi:hypothetical protein
VKEKSGATAYECVYYTQGIAEWRPFILSVKSKVKVQLIQWNDFINSPIED